MMHSNNESVILRQHLDDDIVVKNFWFHLFFKQFCSQKHWFGSKLKTVNEALILFLYLLKNTTHVPYNKCKLKID